MCYYGNGGFTPDVVYTLPIYIRNFYYKKLVDVKKKEEEMAKKSSSNSNNYNKIHRPTFK